MVVALSGFVENQLHRVLVDVVRAPPDTLGVLWLFVAQLKSDLLRKNGV